MPAPQWKGEHHRVARAKKRAKIRTHARDEKDEAKARDGWRCRWPRADHDTPNHICLGPLDAAHGRAIGMGGDKNGTRTVRSDLLSACRWIHQDSPDALQKGGRTWEGLTDRKADGPLIFSRRVPVAAAVGEPLQYEWQEIARERSIGILE